MSEPIKIEDIKRWIRNAESDEGFDLETHVLEIVNLAIAQHAKLEALKRANQDNLNWFHEALARAEKAEAEIERIRPVVAAGVAYLANRDVDQDEVSHYAILMDSIREYEMAKP